MNKTLDIIYEGSFIPELMRKAEDKVLKNMKVYVDNWKLNFPKTFKKQGHFFLHNLQEVINEEYVNEVLNDKAITLCS